MNSPPQSPITPSLREIYAQQVEAAKRKSMQYWELRAAEGRAALNMNPADSGAYLDVADCLIKLRKHKEAIDLLEEGLARCPVSEKLHELRITLLEKCNQTTAAIAAAQTALRIFPDNFWIKMKEALLLPVLYSTDEEVEAYRRRFTLGLEKLVQEISLDSPGGKSGALSAIGDHVNLGLGYQARNDRDLQVKYGEFAHRIVAANWPEFVKPVRMPPFSPAEKLRIGYISGRFRNLSATKCFLGWMTRHSPTKFEVYAYHLGVKTDGVTEEVKRSAGTFRHLTGPLEEIGRTILADQLHILVYLDIGLRPILTQLAAMRLAPIQCLTWDQPITSGLPTMDYFISSALMEPEDGDQHYSERLVRLPGVGVCFQKPVIPKMLLAQERREFGIKENAVAYLCCQAVYKQLPGDDDIFVRIAKRIPKAQFIFQATSTLVARDYRKRLERAFSDAGLKAEDHCVMLGMLDRFAYWNLNVVSDIFLDTIGWSGGVTTIEAIACRLPVVTLPGKWMRSNHAYAILTQLGVTQTIARSKAEYIDIASRLGTDLEWRAEIQQAMVARSPAFYSEEGCVTALEDFFQHAAIAKMNES